jgi:hypothetical protein
MNLDHLNVIKCLQNDEDISKGLKSVWKKKVFERMASSQFWNNLDIKLLSVTDYNSSNYKKYP